MTVFFDTNVLIYGATKGKYQDPCAKLLRATAKGSLKAQTSTAVLEEVLHLELSKKVAGIGGLSEDAYAVFTPLLPVTDEIFRVALSLDAPTLGANDRLHLATCKANNIDMIVSADSDFDGLSQLTRIDPLDSKAVQKLLTS